MWTKPELIEIRMDAEISSYQEDDFDPAKDGPPFVRPQAPAQITSGAPNTDTKS